MIRTGEGAHEEKSRFSDKKRGAIGTSRSKTGEKTEDFFTKTARTGSEFFLKKGKMCGQKMKIVEKSLKSQFRGGQKKEANGG